jgi:hypothetical protein
VRPEWRSWRPHREANSLEAKFKLAEYIANPERLYFNAQLWFGLQSYAMYAAKDGCPQRCRAEEADGGRTEIERRSGGTLAGVPYSARIVRDAGPTDIGRRAAQLAIQQSAGSVTA